MSYLSELGRRLRTAGIEPDDADDVKLKKSLLAIRSRTSPDCRTLR